MDKPTALDQVPGTRRSWVIQVKDLNHGLKAQRPGRIHRRYAVHFILGEHFVSNGFDGSNMLRKRSMAIRMRMQGDDPCIVQTLWRRVAPGPT